jgi:hypothetical protein
MPAGFRWLGFPGAIGAVVVAEAIKYALSVWSVARHRVTVWRRDLAFSLVFAGAAGAGVIARVGVASVLPSALAECAAAGLAVLVVWSPMLLRVAKSIRGA